MAIPAPDNHSVWDEAAADALRGEYGTTYEGRTVLVTGADGFMGSHLTEALVHLGANVHAFVRATSSGALNNIWHLRQRLRVHFADLTDKTSVDFLVKELGEVDPDEFFASGRRLRDHRQARARLSRRFRSTVVVAQPRRASMSPRVGWCIRRR